MPPRDHRPHGPHHHGPPHAAPPPPPHGPHPGSGHPHGPGHPPGRGPARGSLVERFIEPGRIDALLAPWVPDPSDRAFVVRCLLDEGPAHHRGANWVLLTLLGELAAQRNATPATDAGAVGAEVARGGADVARAAGADVARTGAAGPDVASVPLRLPPHLARDRDDETHYPLPMPLAPLRRLAGDDPAALEAMTECLLDGPPQHALANAAMVCFIDALTRG